MIVSVFMFLITTPFSQCLSKYLRLKLKVCIIFSSTMVNIFKIVCLYVFICLALGYMNEEESLDTPALA